MKKLFIILFSLLCLWGHSQEESGPPVYPRLKGEAFFLRDAQGRIITTESGGVLAILGGVDTASSVLVPPPDTIQSFTVTRVDSTVGGFTSLKSEIRSYWTLEEAAGNAVDSVGTVDLPVYGSVTREEAGKIDDCYSFTSSSYLGPVDTYFEFSSSFSMSCWISTTATSAWDCIMSNFGATNYGWELIAVDNPVRNVWWRMRYNWGNIVLEGTTDINDGAWYHIVASYNAIDDTMKLYVNGTLDVAPVINTDGTWYNSEARFHIGSRLAGAYFEGKIDEPALWNKELTQKEVDSLYAESQYPFQPEGSGGDSLRIQCVDFDERADSVRIIANPLGAGRSSSRTDGTLLLAFNMADSADYNDTTMAWPYMKDTTWIIEAYTGLWPEDIWTSPPNHDTTFFDSSDVTPPDQDVGIWDTILYNDFEQHSAPVWYDYNLWQNVDDWNATYLNQQEHWRASDWREPGWWVGQLKDSIIVDPISGSNVLRMSFEDTITTGGYGGNVGRGGDQWKTPLPGAPYTEVYFSYNIMIRPGWDWARGGKFSPGFNGGTFSWSQWPQEYGDGFRMSCIMWDWGYTTPTEAGNIGFYLYYQDQPSLNGEFFPFEDFQPEGVGLTGNYNAGGKFIYPTADSVWYNITLRCVTNTHTGSTPNYDGILEGYVNGHLIEQVGGLYLITYPDIGNEINQFYFYSSFGYWPPQRDEWTLFDDIVIFTYDVSVDVPRGNELSPPGRILSLPNWPKPEASQE